MSTGPPTEASNTTHSKQRLTHSNRSANTTLQHLATFIYAFMDASQHHTLHGWYNGVLSGGSEYEKNMHQQVYIPAGACHSCHPTTASKH